MATYLPFGDPDWVGTLFYLLIFLTSLGAFVLTVYIICKKVFGGRGRAPHLTINPDAAEGGADGRR